MRRLRCHLPHGRYRAGIAYTALARCGISLAFAAGDIFVKAVWDTTLIIQPYEEARTAEDADSLNNISNLVNTRIGS